MAQGEAAGVKAIEVGGRLLGLLAQARGPVALRELAAAGQMSPGKAHRYLASFVSTGLARQDPETRRYSLGPLAMTLGLAALNSYEPVRSAIAFLRELRSRLDETLVLSVWGALGPTVVHVEESSQPVVMTMRVGAVLPMLATATGLVFSAFLPKSFTERLVVAALAERNRNAFAHDKASVDALIERVRADGYAYNNGHLMRSVGALAFPLFDRTGRLIAVMAAMGPEDRLDPNAGTAMIALLKKAVASFS